MNHKTITTILLLAIFLGTSNLRAQIKENEVKSLLDVENYSEAVRIISIELQLNPKDATANYWMGVTLTKELKDLEKALYHLNYSVLKGFSYPDVFFYLGNAYFYNYQFAQAESAFNTYLQKSSKGSDSKKAVLFSQYAHVANDLVHIIKEIKVEEKLKHESTSVACRYLSQRFSNYFCTSYLQYSPNEPNPEYRFVSKPQKRNSKSFNLYELKRTDGMDYKTVELPEFINSEYDELYPFYDSKSGVLYFSSNRPESMGGYDLFFSKYDSVNKLWGSVINMGFPINSPFDELIFFKDSNHSYISTNRLGGPNIETVRFSDDLKETFFSNISNQKLIEIASLALVQKDDIVEKIIPKPLIATENYDEKMGQAIQRLIYTDSLSRILFRINNNGVQNFAMMKRVSKEEELVRQLFQQINVFEQQFEKTIDVEDLIENNEFPNDKSNLSKLSTEKKKDLFGLFTDNSPYNSDQQIPMDQKYQGMVCYKIQLGVFTSKPELAVFKGMHPLSGESIQGSTSAKYYAGIFNSYKLASESLGLVKSNGFNDAYIVAFENGVKVSVQRAMELEKITNAK